MRIGVGLVGLVVCVTLAACTRAAPEPRPDRTLEPSITESSPMPTVKPGNPACRLLTRKDRSDLVGYSMDAEVPVRPANGSVECIWVHSLNEATRAAIRVVALRGDMWAQTLRPQVLYFLRSPTISKALTKKLKRLFRELTENGGRLAADEVCPTYVMLAEARGALREGDSLFYSTMGSMTAAFGVSCEDGNMILAGYGEYGLGPSLALSRGVIRLLDSAKERSEGIFEEVASAARGSEGSDDDAGAGDEDKSPSPEPSPTETDEADSDEEDES